MNCKSCGTAANSNSKFCGACGTSVMADTQAPAPRQCSRCGSALRQGMRFCVSCGNLTGELQPSQLPASPPARPPAYDSPMPIYFSTPQPAPSPSFASAHGAALGRPADAFESANQAVRRIKGGSSAGQKVSLSAALFGTLCFFLPWVEVSCMGMRKTASGPQLASDANLPEVWLVLLAMLSAAGIVALQIMGRKARTPLDKLLSLLTVGAGILPLVICLVEGIRFSNEISKMKNGDSYGFGRVIGSAIENSVSYEFGGILTIVCALCLIIGGFLHLADARKHRGSP
jgi:hypothetical protein